MSEYAKQLKRAGGAIYRGWTQEYEDYDDEHCPPDGWGTLTFPDGRVFVGKFSLGEPTTHSPCVVLFPDKRVRIGLVDARNPALEVSTDGVLYAGPVDPLDVAAAEVDSAYVTQALLASSDLLLGSPNPA